MKESLWGYLIISLGLVIISVLLLVQRLTTTNEEDFYLGREVMEAAMVDAIDYGTYRNTGELVMSEQKFVEVFIRRFAESVTPNKTYSLDFYDIHEYPPKATVRIKTTSGATEIKSDSFDVNIDTFLSGILETIWGQGDLEHITKGSNAPLREEEVGNTGFGGDITTGCTNVPKSTPTTPDTPSTPTTPTTPTTPAAPQVDKGCYCDGNSSDPLCKYVNSCTCNGNKCSMVVTFYSNYMINASSSTKSASYTIKYSKLGNGNFPLSKITSVKKSGSITHVNTQNMFDAWRNQKSSFVYTINPVVTLSESSLAMSKASLGSSNITSTSLSASYGKGYLTVSLNMAIKNAVDTVTTGNSTYSFDKKVTNHVSSCNNSTKFSCTKSNVGKSYTTCSATDSVCEYIYCPYYKRDRNGCLNSGGCIWRQNACYGNMSATGINDCSSGTISGNKCYVTNRNNCSGKKTQYYDKTTYTCSEKKSTTSVSSSSTKKYIPTQYQLLIEYSK